MRNVMGLVLLAMACSSGAVGPGGDGGEAGAGGEPRAGAGSGADAGAGAGKGSAGGVDASGGTGAAGGEMAVAGAGGGDTQPSGGAAGEPSSGGEAGAGGIAHAGEGGGPTPDPEPLGGAGAGGAGGESTDPCDGKTPWDPQASWTEYSQNEQRAFGGVLWRCQNPQFCGTYPGSPNAPGWIKVEDCAGGPTGETAPCQCDEGACCDGCYFRPRSYFCGEVIRTAECIGDAVPACSGATESIDRDFWNLFCNGDTGGDCTRWGAHTRYQTGKCQSGTVCAESGAQAACLPCPG